MAPTAEGNQIGLGCAPVVQGCCPLLSTAQIECAVAAVDHRTVDDAGRDRRDLAGGDGDHHLVVQGQPVLGAIEHDQRLALPQLGQRGQVRVAESLGHRRRLSEVLEARLWVPGVHRTERGGDEQESLHHARFRALVHQPLGPGKPSRGAGPLAHVRQLHSGRPRAASGVAVIAIAQVPGVGATQVVDAVQQEPNEDVGRAEALQIQRVETAVAVCFGQLLDRLEPSTAGVRRAAAFERGRLSRHSCMSSLSDRP